MKIGFIGLGIMGKPMAKNLLKAGYEVYINDIVAAAMDDVVQCGGIKCANVAEVTEKSDLIITMLPDGPFVEQVVLDPDGVLAHARPGMMLVDMSSIVPAVSRKIGAALAEKGVRMLDAPVSGGEPKAIDGTLAIMVGGSEEDFETAKPLFEIMGSSYTLVGDIGSGNICKLANQIIVALNIAALSEGLILAKKAGTDPERVFEAIKGGLAGSTVMNAKAPMMLEGNFKPGFRIDLHIKDLKNALTTGAEFTAPLPLTGVVQSILKMLSYEGEGSSDHSAILKFYEQSAGEVLGKRGD